MVSSPTTLQKIKHSSNQPILMAPEKVIVEIAHDQALGRLQLIEPVPQTSRVRGKIVPGGDHQRRGRD
jgi:hypothetical protein